MKIVTFFNFTNEDFTGSWDSVTQTIKAGERIPMEDWRAAHYAKHLVNRELNKIGGDFVNFTSPKVPQDVPEFWNRFKQAVIENDETPEVTPAEADMAVAAATKKAKAKKAKSEDEFEGLKE